MVRERRTAEAGMNLARDRAAADCFTSLEDERLQPRLREIEGSHEPVVPGADDDYAIGVRRHDATSCRQESS